MRKAIRFVIVLILVSWPVLTLWSQEDAEGCRDHPLLTRMNNYYLSGCEEYEYDSAEFYDVEDNEYVIEGHKWVLHYSLKEDFDPPGQLKVYRNYINAIKRIGGTIINEKDGVMKLTRGGKEIWIGVWASDDGSDYELTIVEKKEMEQEVVADPQALANDIATFGHASVYGIYFDVDSDVIKPESQPSLQAIATLLQNNPQLKVFVVGHTDMTGSLEHNLDLSRRRAQAVVKALVGQFRIAENRLEAKGVGPLSPVATNRNEEGRQLNRRVELVEKL